MKLPVSTLIILFLLMLVKNTSAQTDSSRYLSAAQLLQLVKQYHPVAKQAALLPEKAKAERIIAQGEFDPVFQYKGGQKTFDGTGYYTYDRTGVTIPTWFGVDLSAGTEYLGGSRTDAEDTKGESSYLGISVPLAKNLLMDKRRAALKTARIMQQYAAAEQNSLVNDLILEALNSYWEWVAANQLYDIATEMVTVSDKRLQLVRIAVRQGDRPALDTTEALAQLQSFQLLQSQARNEFLQTGIGLSAYLWEQNGTPVLLPEDIKPAPEEQQLTTNLVTWPDLNRLIETAKANHPKLLELRFKLDALVVEKKLKFQELLPAVNLVYNQLGKGYDFLKTAQAPLFENNFRYGVTVGIPLRLSEGRGAYRKATLEIADTRLKQDQQIQNVELKIRSAHTELAALQQQAEIQQRAVQNYRQLQRGEETRFTNGESSLFLVNARENKTLEARQKLVEVKKKFFQSYNKLLWAAGQLR
ncbi:MAG: TolC family protein [Chitinophagaceae bacterium]|nr:TolC family protein [Chitinophagaceae bacterium]